MKTYLVCFLLAVAVVASALEIVIQRHESRKLFVRSQELNTEVIELGREWGQLLLEQGTWATHGRIEQIARDKLNMTVPVAEKIYRVGSS